MEKRELANIGDFFSKETPDFIRPTNGAKFIIAVPMNHSPGRESGEIYLVAAESSISIFSSL